MDNRPIGIFDSGVGGLTAVRELKKIMPDENIIYFGDTARVPYGTRSSETICRYAMQTLRFLKSFDVKAVVAACGTISTNLPLDDVKKEFPGLMYVSVLEPAVKNAVKSTKNGKIGVIATPASIRSGAYGQSIKRLMPQAQITENPCPLLVPLVESGFTEFDNPITRLTLQMYLEPVIKSGADTLILGCTHYPILYDIIADMAKNITLIDAGASAAEQLKRELEANNMLGGQEGSSIYYITDTIEHFSSVAQKFLFNDIEDKCRHVDLEKFERDFK